MLELILGVILVAAGAAAWAIDPGRTAVLGPETLLAVAAGVILGQGLVRDLTAVVRRRRARGAGKPPEPPAMAERTRWEVNLCLESTVGVVLLFVAAIMLQRPSTALMALPVGLLVSAAGLLVLLGWGTKDWVLTLRHLGDHYDLPVWRKGGPEGETAPKD